MMPEILDVPVSAARTSGELRVVRSSGGARVITDDLRAIPVVRGADIRSAARTSGVHAAPRVVPRTRSEMANRVLNVTLALTAIVLLSPVFLLVALLVRLTSPGPILYVQARVGIDRRSRRVLALYDRRARDAGGCVFTMYKFRSMCVDAEGVSGAVWAKPHDPRVTPIGRVLRATRFDELPQLFNVLKGDMNIVGPRPERPSIVAQLRKDISEYALRHRAKPGITGLAQISQAYDQSLDDVRHKVRYDLEYLSRQSLAEDLRIMIKTLPVMLFKRGGW
jgi:lipopolysaccharide/colanic/teichoic acid biosynthesis glycosyltransferase